MVLPEENHMQSTEAATLDRKSGEAEGSAVPSPGSCPQWNRRSRQVILGKLTIVRRSRPVFEETMASLIDAIDVKRKMFVEFENVPFHCLEAEISTPTARGGQDRKSVV